MDTTQTKSLSDQSQMAGPDYLHPTPEQAESQRIRHGQGPRHNRRSAARAQIVTARQALNTAIEEIRERRVPPAANAPECEAPSTPSTSLTAPSRTSLQERTKPSLPARIDQREYEALSRPASRQTIAGALSRVIADLGISVAPDRVQLLVIGIEEAGWTDRQVTIAARELIMSGEFRKTIRYAGTLTLADFAAVIDPPSEAILSTPKGYPLRVAAGKLYSYPEMLSLFEATGGQHGPWQSTDRFAEPVFPPGWVPGTHKPLWRLRLSSDSPTALRQPEPIAQ